MTTISTENIAQMLGVTRKHVTNRLTKHPGFPAPVINVSQKVRRWDEEEVRRWVAGQSRRAAMSSDATR
jgi:predicted DNA-binding transcriptional regulator AlpA